MSMNDEVKRFRCGLSKDGFEHIHEDPVLLSCWHNVCRKCFNKKPNHEFTCLICGDTNKYNFSEKKNDKSEIFLKQKSKELLKFVVERLEQKIPLLNDVKNDFIEPIDKQVEFIKDEIQIRVDSMKTELDIICDQMFNKIDQLKESFLADGHCSINNPNALKDEINSIKKLQQPDVNKVFEFQHKLIELEELLENLDGHKFDIQLELSEFKHDSRFVGIITSKYEIEEDKKFFSPTIYEDYSRLRQELDEKNDAIAAYLTNTLELQQQNQRLTMSLNRLNTKIESIYEVQKRLNNIFIRKFNLDNLSFDECNLILSQYIRISDMKLENDDAELLANEIRHFAEAIISRRRSGYQPNRVWRAFRENNERINNILKRLLSERGI